MKRHRKSPLEDLMELIALLPWQASLFLAPVSYLVLHHYAIQDASSPAGLENASSAVLSSLMKAGATFGQYVLPAMCLFGVLVSFSKRQKRQSLLHNTARHGKCSALLDLSWQDFERLAGEAFRHQGYTVTENAAAGPDGGIDLVLKKGNETTLVQCKQWRAQRVGVSVVRELYGVMSAKGATGGIVVCAGDFTRDARAFAKGRNITLMDGPGLLELIGNVSQASLQPGRVPGMHPEPSSPSPSCPACGSTMVKRIARKGASSGNAFWGCSQFPDCRGTRPFVN